MRGAHVVALLLVTIGALAAYVAPSEPQPHGSGPNSAAPPSSGAGRPVAPGLDGGPPSATSRCPEGTRKRLIVRWKGQIIRDDEASKAMSALGAERLTQGRHAGEPGLNLARLLRERPEARSLQVIPCSGEPVAFEAGELSADPARRILVVSRRGAFKLIDRDGDPKTPLAKNVAEIVLGP